MYNSQDDDANIGYRRVNDMQATDEAEVTRHITVQMGSRTYETEHEYTRAQAEEIHKMVIESAREAVGNDWSIEARKFELVP